MPRLKTTLITDDWKPAVVELLLAHAKLGSAARYFQSGSDKAAQVGANKDL
jgi:hypothetical protein